MAVPERYVVASAANMSSSMCIANVVVGPMSPAQICSPRHSTQAGFKNTARLLTPPSILFCRITSVDQPLFPHIEVPSNEELARSDNHYQCQISFAIQDFPDHYNVRILGFLLWRVRL